MRTTFATIVLLLSYSPAQSQQISWEHTNGPYGGVIYTMADDGDGRLFVGTEGDGVFRSEDNGETWVETNDGLTNFLIYTLAVNQDGQVFAGTDGNGIFRLDVGGTTWTAVNSGLYSAGGQPAIINALAINDSGHVFAALLFRGVYRSTDNGESWTPVNTGLTDLDVIALAINGNNEIFVSTFSDGIFRSTNNGASWDEKGLSGTGQRLYAILTLPGGEVFTGRWRSTDNGESWLPTESAQANISFWSFHRFADGNVYTSTNAGVFKYESQLWLPVGTGLPTMTTFTVLQRANDDIFAGSGGMGVYKLNGTDWTPKTTGITNVDIRALARGQGSDVYAASYFSGIFRSTDGGASWSRTKVDVDLLRSVCITVTPAGTLLAGTWRIIDTEAGKVFRSTDHGETWEKVLHPLVVNTDIQTFAIAPDQTIFVGTVGDSLYKSTDDGLTWQSVVTNNLTSAVFFSLSSNSSGQLFAGTLTNGLMRSSDGGDNWASAQNGLPSEVLGSSEFPFVRSMVFNAADIAFAGTDGGGVYFSLNNGDNWLDVNTGLTNKYVTSLSINQQGDIFAGTENGVFRMINNSENWSRVVSGLGNTYVRSVLVTESGHMLAGTWGSGMFRTVSPTTGVQQIAGDLPMQFSLEQNYPNPFNPGTVISYQLPVDSWVTLRVYNLVGQEVALLVNSKLQAGTYRATWDASAQPSGVYFYRLQAGSFIETKRAVLLK